MDRYRNNSCLSEHAKFCGDDYFFHEIALILLISLQWRFIFCLSLSHSTPTNNYCRVLIIYSVLMLRIREIAVVRFLFDEGNNRR